jgi:hypothetical protein
MLAHWHTRSALLVLLVLTYASAAEVFAEAPADDTRDHLVGVQRSTVHFSFPPRVQEVQGSGICINQSCSVVATAYHVQVLAGGANLRIASDHTEKVLSLANESDTNKSDVPAGKRTLSYNIANDVSFVYTKKPVPHKSGVPYSYKFYVGQKVKVAGYYNHTFETREARIIGSNVPLVIGQAQLKENLVLDIYVKPGTSGSAVLDERGKLLGMIVLSGALKFSNGNLAASVALPVRTIAKALVKLDPVLGSAIFNDIPEEEPKPVQTPSVLYQESDLPEDTSRVIPELSAVLSEVPNSVGRLRAKSEAASKLMVNFVTKQCLVQGTQKSLCDELSIVDGQQTFREIHKNGKLGKPTGSFPIQKHGVWTQSDWTDTLGEIADNPWVFQGSVDDHYLFTFKSAAEDDRCYYEEYSQGTPLFGGGHQGWKGPVVCFEQILTDKDFNVLSVFTEMHPPDGCLTQLVQTAIYYDWIKLEEIKSPILLPVMERITAKVLGQKDLWYANASWTDYKKFRAEHKIKF